MQSQTGRKPLIRIYKLHTLVQTHFARTHKLHTGINGINEKISGKFHTTSKAII